MTTSDLSGAGSGLLVSLLIGIWLALGSVLWSGEESPPWPSQFVNQQGQRFVLISGGTFQMGPVEPQWPKEAPRHEVTLSPFYLMSFEVTKGQFRRFAEATGIAAQFSELDPKAVDPVEGCRYLRAPGEAFPVFAIDWYTAQAYSRWVSAQDGRTYRLPSEAEWEYACRAGTETRRWWGDDWYVGMALTRATNYSRTPYDLYALPGTGPANPWGLYEILGNAGEWTGDWYAAYDSASATNPSGPLTGKSKVVRGGAVGWTEDIVTSFLRGPYDPREPASGIRLVCVPNSGPAPAAPAAPPKPPADPAPTMPVVTVALSAEVMLDLVKLPAGTFRMGSPSEEFGHGKLEEPLTTVTISYSFLVGRHEVTQRQYELVMGQNPSRYQHPDHPVEQVTHAEAHQFGETLTKRERAAGRLSEDEVYRLPTEPEWEYACRAGTTTAYSFGDDAAKLPFYGWCDLTGGTHPVGTKRPNPWGLYDLHGNVQEWCRGTPRPLPGGERQDPLRRPGASSKFFIRPECWDDHGPEMTIRGGGWCFGPHACRSAMRQGFHHGGRYDFVGFRLVRAPSSIDVSPAPDK